MALQFTPAAERALAAASRWALDSAADSIEPAAVLLGLLDEPECRAAVDLARLGVDGQQVRRRWPDMALRPHPLPQPARRLAPSLQSSLEASAGEAAPRHDSTLDTGHLLRALVHASREIADWLTAFGLSADDPSCGVEQPQNAGIGPPLDVPADDTRDRLFERTSGAPQALKPATSPDPNSLQTPRLSQAVWRIVDAAANRAREGLRVLEDYTRFGLDDLHLTTCLKQLRHDLFAVLAIMDSRVLLTARDTQADVGTAVSTPAERQRHDVQGVVAANFKRLEEALRSLEEYGKLFDAAVSEDVERLRYRVYTLERAVGLTSDALKKFAGAQLYVLLDGRQSPEAFTVLAKLLIGSGADVIQLRDKNLGDRQLVERARDLRRITRETRTLCVINDRPDIAALVGADGVHVGQDELSVKDARAVAGPHMLVGVSTHSIEQARQAVLDGADYIGVGPTFASQTKSFEPGQLAGLALLRAVAGEIRLPAFAIGGIDIRNLPQVLETGFTRVAVGQAIVGAADPAAAASAIAAILAEPRDD